MSVAQQVQFETPEQIVVRYELAGLGTRFIAWVIDRILILLLFFVLIMMLLFSGIGFTFLFKSDGGLLSGYTLGLVLLIQGLGSFLYFALSELYMGGQTFGKRHSSIRVVNASGFSLTPWSIVIRNIFRVIDQLPVFWIVPLATRHSQRFGDLVAGTVVIVDDRGAPLGFRSALSEDPARETEFRFEDRILRRLPTGDFEAIERILEHWSELDEPTRENILQKVCDPLASKLHCAAPPREKRLRFVKDLLRAEYRRQSRGLR